MTAILLVGGPGRAFVDAVGHTLGADPAWVVLGAAHAGISLAGYIGLLWLIAGARHPGSGGARALKITLAGASAAAADGQRRRRRCFWCKGLSV